MQGGRYTKKPVTIDAIHWDGSKECYEVVLTLVAEGFESNFVFSAGDGFLYIRTLEGTMFAAPGDWIIRGVKGEIYPCRNDIFEETYEPEETI